MMKIKHFIVIALVSVVSILPLSAYITIQDPEARIEELKAGQSTMEKEKEIVDFSIGEDNGYSLPGDNEILDEMLENVSLTNEEKAILEVVRENNDRYMSSINGILDKLYFDYSVMKKERDALFDYMDGALKDIETEFHEKEMEIVDEIYSEYYPATLCDKETGFPPDSLVEVRVGAVRDKVNEVRVKVNAYIEDVINKANAEDALILSEVDRLLDEFPMKYEADSEMLNATFNFIEYDYEREVFKFNVDFSLAHKNLNRNFEVPYAMLTGNEPAEAGTDEFVLYRKNVMYFSGLLKEDCDFELTASGSAYVKKTNFMLDVDNLSVTLADGGRILLDKGISWEINELSKLIMYFKIDKLDDIYALRAVNNNMDEFVMKEKPSRFKFEVGGSTGEKLIINPNGIDGNFIGCSFLSLYGAVETNKIENPLNINYGLSLGLNTGFSVNPINCLLRGSVIFKNNGLLNVKCGPTVSVGYFPDGGKAGIGLHCIVSIPILEALGVNNGFIFFSGEFYYDWAFDRNSEDCCVVDMSVGYIYEF